MGYQLKNEQLIVDIAERGHYRGTRFDWSGFITGVTLRQGNHSFCVPESLTPGLGTGGEGLCNEFGIADPIGYEETQPGEMFPKLGVGLLTRGDEAGYQFYKQYPVIPFRQEVIQDSASELSYTIYPQEYRGYAAQLEKRVRLEDHRLIIDYTLHNEGSKTISTTEYNHNFLGMDQRGIGPGCTLKFPFELEPEVDEEGSMDNMLFQGREIHWSGRQESWFYFRLRGAAQAYKPQGWIWDLYHSESRAGVREISTYTVDSIAVWGEKHVISPEIFIRLHVAPGEIYSWSRVYEFYKA